MPQGWKLSRLNCLTQLLDVALSVHQVFGRFSNRGRIHSKAVGWKLAILDALTKRTRRREVQKTCGFLQWEPGTWPFAAVDSLRFEQGHLRIKPLDLLVEG